MSDQPIPPSEKADAIEAALIDAKSLEDAIVIYAEAVTDLRAQLAAFQAVAVQMVPGEHGEGVEAPATPDFLKNLIAGLQKEWDGAEAQLAAQKLHAIENEKQLMTFVESAKKAEAELARRQEHDAKYSMHILVENDRYEAMEKAEAERDELRKDRERLTSELHAMTRHRDDSNLRVILFKVRAQKAEAQVATLIHALTYCETQIRCVWNDPKLEYEYQELHRRWALDTAQKALRINAALAPATQEGKQP